MFTTPSSWGWALFSFSSLGGAPRPVRPDRIVSGSVGRTHTFLRGYRGRFTTIGEINHTIVVVRLLTFHVQGHPSIYIYTQTIRYFASRRLLSSLARLDFVSHDATGVHFNPTTTTETFYFPPFSSLSPSPALLSISSPLGLLLELAVERHLSQEGVVLHQLQAANNRSTTKKARQITSDYVSSGQVRSAQVRSGQVPTRREEEGGLGSGKDTLTQHTEYKYLLSLPLPCGHYMWAAFLSLDNDNTSSSSSSSSSS